MSREPSAEPGTRSSPPGSVRSTSPSIGMYYVAELTNIERIAEHGRESLEAQDSLDGMFLEASDLSDDGSKHC